MVGERWRMAGAAGLVLVALAVGCRKHQEPAAAPPIPMKPAPPTPIDTKRAEIGGAMWDPAWDKIVEEALPPEMLSAQVAQDVRPFCPQFNAIGEADKRAFWAYFFQALAGAEAGLKPTSEVRHSEPAMEGQDQVTGVQGRTEGLLQLAYEDQKRYGCAFDFAADRTLKVNDPARTILNPKNNLECGVKILDQQIIGQHKPLLSRSGYWSTLRPGTASYRAFAKQMANVPAACGMAAKPMRREAAR